MSCWQHGAHYIQRVARSERSVVGLDGRGRRTKPREVGSGSSASGGGGLRGRVLVGPLVGVVLAGAFGASAAAQERDDARVVPTSAVLGDAIESAPRSSLGELDAVRRAVESSPALRATRFDRDAALAAVRSAIGARGATFTANAQGSHNESFNAAPTAVTRGQQDTLSLGATFSAMTDLGTTFDLGLSSSVGWRTANLNPSMATLFSLGPNYGTTLTLDLRQPLLRGAGEDATLGARRQAEAAREAADYDARTAASQLVRDVVVAHRELAYAEDARSVSRDAVTLAEQQAREAETRVSLGTVARTEALRFAAELASARRTLRAADVTVETAALTLAQLVGVTVPAASGLHAERDDAPIVGRLVLAELVEDALASSPELASLAANVESLRARERTLADADEVRLDVIAQLGVGVLYNPTTISDFTLPDGRPALSATGGVELELPVGDSQARADRQQASAAVDAAIARQEARRTEIERDVASAIATLIAARERAGLANEAASIAHELAEAERTAQRLGTATSLEVVVAQQSERTSALDALRAEADAREAEVRLADLTGALLARYGVEVANTGGAR